MLTAKRIPSLRIVSLAPSATAILCAIGAKKCLVGVTKWCGEVAPVGGLPKLGDCWHMDSVDEVLKLRPSLIIGSVPYKQETVARLLEHPLNFLAMNPRTLADVEQDIRLLGRLTDRLSQAEHLVAGMSREFGNLAKRYGNASPRLRVYCEAWPNPRISSPPWVAELVNFCGGEMVLPPGQRISDRDVADARPEVIVLAWAATGAKSKPQRSYQVAAWKNVPAIRNKQVYAVRDELLNTPGPPLLRGAKQLCRIFRIAKTKGAK